MENNPTHHTTTLTIILVSYFMIVLDISIVITALPKIQHNLGFSLTGLSWVQNAYTLAFGGLLLLGARAGDILGRRRLFTLGLAVFTLASLAVGLAQSASWLVAARVLQGVGAAMLAPSILALLTINFSEGEERTRALAYYAAVGGGAASIGIVLGGIIADWLSWRVGFFVNVPIGILLILGAHRYLAETPRHVGKFDLTGALSSTAGMASLIYGIVRSASVGWHDPMTLAAVTLGVLLLALLVLNEGRAHQPIMPLHLFVNRERSGAYSARVLFLGAMMGFFFFTTQYLQEVVGFTPFEAGMAFLPATLPNFVVAMLVPRFTERVGNARVLATALVTGMIGMFWLGHISPDTHYLSGIALPMVLIGISQGAALGPLTVSGVAGIEGKDVGAASGLVNVAHQLGGSLGLGILVVIFTAASSSLLGAQALLAHRVASALTAGSVMLALAFIIVITFIVRPCACTVRDSQYQAG